MNHLAPEEFERLRHHLEDVANVRSGNARIADQNERLPALQAIHDADFRAVAKSGLEAEQQESVQAVAEAAARIPYDEIGAASLRLSHAAQEAYVDLHEARQEADMQVAELIKDAGLAADLSPRSAAEVTILLGRKTVALEERISPLKGRAESLQQLEEDTYRQYGSPWTIPNIVRAIGVPAVTPPVSETEVQPVPVMSQEEPAELEEVQPEWQPLSDVFDAFAPAVTLYALQNGAFRIEEMHGRLPELQALSEDDYWKFKDYFPRLRDVIVERFAAEEGIRAEWTRTGRSRGVRYRLRLSGRIEDMQAEETSVQAETEQPAVTPVAFSHVEAPVELPTVEPTPEPVEFYVREPQAVPERPMHPNTLSLDLEAEQLIEIPLIQLVRSVYQTIRAQDEKPLVKQAILIKEVANELNDDEELATLLVRTMIQKELFFRLKQHGSRFITEERPTEADITAAEDETSLQTPEEIQQEIVRDLKIAKLLLTSLTIKPAASYAIERKALLQRFAGSGIATELVQETMRRLSAADVLKIAPNGNKSRLLVRFSDAAEKRAWRRNEKAYLTRLESRLREIYAAEATDSE